MKETPPNRPYTSTLIILIGLLLISIPIMMPAFKVEIIAWIDRGEKIPEYSSTTYNLLWLLTYLIGTSVGIIFIGYGAIRVIRMLRKDNHRVHLD